MTEQTKNTKSDTSIEQDIDVSTEESNNKETDSLLNQSIPCDSFDWDEIINLKSGSYSLLSYPEEERNKYEEIYYNSFNLLKSNQIVTGKIVLINDREVVINVGYKSDGLVSLSEFRDMPDLKVGDEVEVLVEKPEDKNGQLILSRKKAKIHYAWEEINKALEEDRIIIGKVKSRTKGGLIVDVNGIEAFLPGSQIDVKPVRDYDIYVGQTMEFKVVKINHEFRNVVISHKILIEHDIENQRVEIMSKLEKGQILEGVVKNITSFGAFIDLGCNIDGLLHVYDLHWGRVTNIEDIVKLDDKINVVVLDFDDDKKRISLGLKQLYPHPWDSLDPEIKVGSRVKGKVVTIADYGAFIEIEPACEALLHITEATYSQHVRNPREILNIGDIVEAIVLTIDREARKMSVGMKQLIEDPWANAAEEFAVGSRHKAIVRNMTKFGIFVEIKVGVYGLIHISHLSWSKKISSPDEFAKINDEIEVVVLEVDIENRKLSLGHKQLEDNPWDTFETIFTVDSIHKGTIVKKNEKGAIVMLPYGVEGFVSLKHILKEDGSSVELDESADFKVIEFNKESKKIILSHTKTWDLDQDTITAEKERLNKRKPKKSPGSEESKTTLGDLGVLASLKEKMQQESDEESRSEDDKENSSDKDSQ